MQVIDDFLKAKRQRVVDRERTFMVWVRDPQELEFTQLNDFIRVFGPPGPFTVGMASEVVRKALGMASGWDGGMTHWDEPRVAPYSLEPDSDFVEFTVRITEYGELLGWLHFRLAEV